MGICPLGTTALYNDILDNRPFSVSSYNVKEGTAKLKHKVTPVANYGATQTSVLGSLKSGPIHGLKRATEPMQTNNRPTDLGCDQL